MLRIHVIHNAFECIKVNVVYSHAKNADSNVCYVIVLIQISSYILYDFECGAEQIEICMYAVYIKKENILLSLSLHNDPLWKNEALHMHE